MSGVVMLPSFGCVAGEVVTNGEGDIFTPTHKHFGCKIYHRIQENI